ncbi:MAG: PaaI family thioesterase [Boseongicola sp.]|nr:PaaI family thioesterase [Boseongicola sp.]MDE0344800.1 PaaI family thioesterase [Boseongicola sp.]MXW86351.1 PaaI family thioesterase [Boseongicola sp. SB0667_bin_21]MYI68933.1 PaaI family thioesterase [Boseongicola sp. SB0673_bin_14]
MPDKVGIRGTGKRRFIDELPFCRAMNMVLEEVGEGTAVVSMPWNDRLVGDPVTGVAHGGAVSSLLDTCGGVAVLSHPARPSATATLNFRIDYMRPATPGQTITAHATCFHLTRTVAFVRTLATDEDKANPVATATGAFVVQT